MRSNSTRTGGFTLTELLVAITVLIVVLFATSRIFSSASKVAGAGEATSNVLQTAAAIESQIRADFAHLSRDGFFVVQCVEAAGTRADQLVFFTQRTTATQQFMGSRESSATNAVASTWLAESGVARVYYGHGVSSPNLGPDQDTDGFNNGTCDGSALTPWASTASAGNATIDAHLWSAGTTQGSKGQPSIPKENWPLLRNALLLAKDGAAPSSADLVYAANFKNATSVLSTEKQRPWVDAWFTSGNPNPTGSSYDPTWLSGRVDVCTMTLGDIKKQITGSGLLPFITGTTANPWTDSQRTRMLQCVGFPDPFTNGGAKSQPFLRYPRAEKATPSMGRADSMLASSILSANCSSFRVEWTWSDGVGRGPYGLGMTVAGRSQTPWFGLCDQPCPIYGITANNVRPVSNHANYVGDQNGEYYGTIDAPLVLENSAIPPDGASPVGRIVCCAEGVLNLDGSDCRLQQKPVWQLPAACQPAIMYAAAFGYNSTDPSVSLGISSGNGPYTPWPSAVRITIKLHDPNGRLEGGREFQFIVELPRP